MFDAAKERVRIVEWIRDWFERNGKGCKAVLGISGGKDSTVVAALCAEALGKDNVVGVMMPNSYQRDINDSYKVVKTLGIQFLEVNIGKAVTGVLAGICRALDWEETNMKPFPFTPQMEQNLPPRIRMSALYAVSQCVNGRVANTCNLSETMIGWETKWGDAVGDFAPLANYTATEVVAIGKTIEELPVELVEKAPSDGLCGKTDEDSFGFTYKQLDTYLRTGASGDEEADVKIAARIKNSEFKRRPTESCPYTK